MGVEIKLTDKEFPVSPVFIDFLYRHIEDQPHEATWHDDNGHSHVRASLLGPSLTVPFVDGHLCLGQWQQIVLIDFDTRPRRREIILQFLGE